MHHEKLNTTTTVPLKEEDDKKKEKSRVFFRVAKRAEKQTKVESPNYADQNVLTSIIQFVVCCQI